MNLLAREIYGREPWVIASSAFLGYQQLLRDLRNGAKFDNGERSNTLQISNLKTGTSVSVDQRKNSSTGSEQLISITNINGIITKSGGASSRGMKEISSELLSLDADPEVIGHLFIVDSPGGSASGMTYMQQTMNQLQKPIVGIVERSGIAASGGYGILSHADYVMAEDGNSEVGSIGTMFSFSGVPNGKKDGNGEVNYSVYATKSTKKNFAVEQAINTGDTSLIISELLDPFNEQFIANTKEKRPNILDSQLDGSMYQTADVVGTMIDKIGTKAEAINKILELSKSNNTFIKNKKTKAMTAAELLAQHPDTHAEVFELGRKEGRKAGHTKGLEEGRAAEAERVKTWQVYEAVDPEAVSKGIASGKEITTSETQSFLLKAASGNKLLVLKTDSAAPVVTPEAENQNTEITAAEKEFNDTFGKFGVKYKPQLN